MDNNSIKNVKLNLEISQDAACVILDRLVRAAVDIPSAHDNNALITYIDEQALLDNYPDGALDIVIADHRSKLQAAYDCCTVALELYEAIEASREQESNEKPAPESKAPEVGTQVSNEKPAAENKVPAVNNQVSNEKPVPKNKVPKGSHKVVFKIYGSGPYRPDAEASIIWDPNKGGFVHCSTSRGICRFRTRQELVDYIINVLTPANSLKEYTDYNKYTVEEKELVLSVTRKLLAELGVPDHEDYSGELTWKCVNS